MAQNGLTTYMGKGSDSISIDPSARVLWLPAKIVLVTNYNAQLNGRPETTVTGSDSEGEHNMGIFSSIDIHSSPNPLEEQHKSVVDVYRELGYKITPDNGKPNNEPEGDLEQAARDERLRNILGYDLGRLL
jgi:hypothetical protein